MVSNQSFRALQVHTIISGSFSFLVTLFIKEREKHQSYEAHWKKWSFLSVLSVWSETTFLTGPFKWRGVMLINGAYLGLQHRHRAWRRPWPALRCRCRRHTQRRCHLSLPSPALSVAPSRVACPPACIAGDLPTRACRPCASGCPGLGCRTLCRRSWRCHFLLPSGPAGPVWFAAHLQRHKGQG